MKQIHLQSAGPIEVPAKDFLKTINALRKKNGQDAKSKSPLDLASALSQFNLFEKRNSKRGALFLRLCYTDEDGSPCSREFPNFGLTIESSSSMEIKGSNIALTVDFIVKAGKPKWQVAEIEECAGILASGRFWIELHVMLDESTDWSGRSQQLATSFDAPSELGLRRIPGACFRATAK